MGDAATNDDAKVKTGDSSAGHDVTPCCKVKQERDQATNPYLALQSHPQFKPLFTKHPNLKIQLQRVHQASQNPYDNPPRADDRKAPRPRIRERVQGQWTQDKADDLAAKALMDLRKQDEGVKEFMDLVNEVFRPSGGVESKDEG